MDSCHGRCTARLLCSDLCHVITITSVSVYAWQVNVYDYVDADTVLGAEKK